MKYIEIINTDGKKCTIYVKFIQGLQEEAFGGTRIIVGGYGKYVETATPYKEVKDMIAACYGGEDEED